MLAQRVQPLFRQIFLLFRGDDLVLRRPQPVLGGEELRPLGGELFRCRALLQHAVVLTHDAGQVACRVVPGLLRVPDPFFCLAVAIRRGGKLELDARQARQFAAKLPARFSKLLEQLDGHLAGLAERVQRLPDPKRQIAEQLLGVVGGHLARAHQRP